MAGNYANGHRARQLGRWLRSQHRPCWICQAFGKPGTIDYSLPSGHPYSFEVDHLVPTSRGGDPYSRRNVDAAHRCCNQWRGNRTVDEVLSMAAHRHEKKAPTAYAVNGVTSALSD